MTSRRNDPLCLSLRERKERKKILRNLPFSMGKLYYVYRLEFGKQKWKYFVADCRGSKAAA